MIVRHHNDIGALHGRKSRPLRVYRLRIPGPDHGARNLLRKSCSEIVSQAAALIPRRRLPLECQAQYRDHRARQPFRARSDGPTAARQNRHIGLARAKGEGNQVGPARYRLGQYICILGQTWTSHPAWPGDIESRVTLLRSPHELIESDVQVLANECELVGQGEHHIALHVGKELQELCRFGVYYEPSRSESFKLLRGHFRRTIGDAADDVWNRELIPEAHARY